MRTSTGLWLAALLACLAVGVIFGIDGRPSAGWPRHFGYYVAGSALVAGIGFSWRGALLPVVGIVAFGVTRLIGHPTDPGGDDQRVLFVFYFTYFPVLFALPALVGAGMREAARWWFARPLPHHGE